MLNQSKNLWCYSSEEGVCVAAMTQTESFNSLVNSFIERMKNFLPSLEKL